MAGPFDIKPFTKTYFSPLMDRNKLDGGVFVIVDLSRPIGQSVNGFIPDDLFENINLILKYPSIDMIIQKLGNWVVKHYFLRLTWKEHSVN